MVTAEQNLYGRLLVLRKMVKLKSYPDCAALVAKFRFDLANFSNTKLRDEITGDILAMEKIAFQERDKEEIMQDLDKKAELLIGILEENGLK